MADLLTLVDLKARLDVDTADTTHDAFYTKLIPAVSTSIINYTDRDFGASQVTEVRTFQYEGDGVLDIDDADTITAVAFVVPNSTDVPLDATYQYLPQPPRTSRTPVFTYLLMPETWRGGYSTEMGFTRNLDVVARERGLPWALPTSVKVTATWGWPTVPEDVKQAAAWTVREWQSRNKDEGLTSEAIEGYARSWGRGAVASGSLAIPNRARDILVNYQRVFV